MAVMRQTAESYRTAPSGSRQAWTRTPSAAELAEDLGIIVVDCPVIGIRETAKQGRLVVLAPGTENTLDPAQPIFDASGSKTVRLEPGTGRASRMKLVATAWTVALAESLRSQLSRAARRRTG